MTVATAAPATPRGVYRINTISRITLVTDEMTRNKKALRESPMARRPPPDNCTGRRKTVLQNDPQIPVGVLHDLRRCVGCQQHPPGADNTEQGRCHRKHTACNERCGMLDTLNIFISLCPRTTAPSNMPTPMDRPTRKNKTTDMIGLATLTAPNALFPSSCRRSSPSAVLYSCWNIFPHGTNNT